MTQGSGTPPTNNTIGATDNAAHSEFYELLVKSNAEQAKATEFLRERAGLLRQSADLIKEELALQNSIATNMLNTLNRQKSIKEEIDRLNQMGSEMKEQDEARLKFLKEQLLIMETQSYTMEEELKNIKDKSAEQEQYLSLLQTQVEYQENGITQYKKLSEILAHTTLSEEEKVNALERAKAINKEVLKVQSKIQAVSEKVGKSVGLSAQYSDTFLGKTEDMFAQYKSLGKHMSSRGGMGKILKGTIGQTFNLKNAFSAIVEETFKIAVNIDNISKELGRATGFGNVFQTQIRDVGSSLTLLGGDEKMAGEVIKSMTENLSSFNPTAQRTNMYVATTAGKLQLLGVSASSSVKSMEYMQRTMGMTAKQAADATAQIARMGKEIGVSGTKMINDFNAASGRLSIYGKQNVEVFKKMSAAAKASGIEMQTLLSITSKFDKFDTAADSVSQLNAVLATQLSTLDMLAADDADKVLMMKEQVQASIGVGGFDSLDKFTKMHVAQAMGVKDVAEAQKLLNMTTAEYQKYQQGQQESADIQAEMAKASAELVPTMQKLGIAMMKIFKIFTPFINGFLMIGEFIDGLYSSIAEWFDGFSGAASVFVDVLKYIGVAILIATAPISTTVAVIMGLVAALGAVYDIIHRPGSLSMAEGVMDKTIGNSIKKFGDDALKAKGDLSNLNKEMGNMYDAAHPNNGAMDLQAVANLDTSAIAAGFDKIKSIAKELSKIKMDGFLAIRTDGASTSLLMGSEDIVAGLSNGTLTVDVKMPEFKMPDISVKVYIGNTELRDIIRTEVKAVVGAAG